jgi:hypothetical protein
LSYRLAAKSCDLAAKSCNLAAKSCNLAAKSCRQAYFDNLTLADENVDSLMSRQLDKAP